MHRFASPLLAATLCTGAGVGAAFAQQTTTVPPDAKAAHQPEPWTQIPIPPLAEFHPQQPKRIELKNGLVILLQEDHELPFIGGTITIRGGSRDVPAAKVGLVGLYGDTWRTSGTTAQDGDKLDDLLEAKAAKVETSGDIDSTGVSWSCLAKDEDQVFGIALDLLEHPAFKADKLTLAKQQAITGIVRRNDEVEEVAQREATKLVFGADSPYARQPEIATVMSVTLDDLKAWHEKTVAPNNIIVSVEGDFDPAEMEHKLRAAFEGMPRGTAWPKPGGEFPGPKPGLYVINKPDVNQSNVWIVGLGTERSNPDFYALAVMNEIFSGGFGSRLFQDVRTRLGLAYSVSGGYGASYDHPGMFYTTAMTKSASTVAATKAMLDQIDKLKTEPFTDAELQSAKDQLLNSFIFRVDSKDKVLTEASTLEFYGYPADFLEKYQKAIEAVTTADLARVAKKYIDPSKLAILVVGNQSEFGTPLSEMNMGQPHPVDITIPMPAAMRQQMEQQQGPGN
ncbi:insulinase family protein [Silvibacterium dinghuense]|uniref:Insulinase family protein n=2 Tax=Silvibacterium dinghuense TaxID=1560006 RepID=A0A4Q1SKT0_9BACT|nr:insulinase family protein [Silvibacterium dinghuense]